MVLMVASFVSHCYCSSPLRPLLKKAILSILLLFIIINRTNHVNSETTADPLAPTLSTTINGQYITGQSPVDNDEEEVTIESTTTATETESSFLFTRLSYNVSIPENSFGKMYAISTEKMGIYITDPALVVRYKIVGGDFDKIFKAESRHVGDFYFLLIRIRSGYSVILNREYRHSYELRIRATITSLRNDALRLKSKCNVFVTVTDKNDLSPFFYPETYEVSVPEDIPLDSSIIRVSAVDPDIGLNGEIYYSLYEESLTFAVHPTMGIISATRPLTLSSDANRPQTHHLTVLAQDRGIHHSSQVLESSKAKVIVTVIPVNKHVPRITFKQHSALSTRTPVNPIYAVVHVTDDDSGDFGQICSVIIVDGDDQHLFGITNSSSSDYNIELVRPYLNESATTSVFNLIIKAIDCGGAFATQPIVVTLNSAKTGSPHFDSDHYYTEIHEVSLIGTQVIKLTATVQEKDGLNLRYNIIDGNYDEVFGITSNGVVFTRQLLDRETQSKYMLVISARIGSTRMSTTQLHIRLIDDNDNYPVFNIDKSQISVSINENKPNGSSVFRITASDLDSGDNGLVTYELMSQLGTSLPFTIDHSTGEIKAVKTLDYETGPHHYQLLIRASDWGEPFRRQTQISLNLTLKDVNDHRPQFEKNNCTANIPVNTKPWTEIMTFSAIDLDEGSIVSYKMFTPNADKCFNLNENTGILRLTCNLKDELDKSSSLSDISWTLSISATDGHYFSDTSYVKIVIVDDNDGLERNKRTARNSILVECNDLAIAQKLTMYMIQRHQENDVNYDSLEQIFTDKSINDLQKHKNRMPEFDQNIPKEIYIPENIEKGSKITTLIANDPDPGFDGLLIWSLNCHNITQHNRNHYSDKIVFNIDQFTGDLYVIDDIDYEQHSKYKLHITVCDLGHDQLCANHTIVVVVEDINDNSPIIENFVFNVSESSSPGFIIGQLYATDEDYGNNALLQYSLKGYRDVFALDHKNGTLTLEKHLDREEIDQYILYVSVHDSGTPSLTSSSMVTIHVNDVNDNPPRFHESSYVFKVREDMPIGSRIMKITAFDSDEGKAGKIHYSIKSNKFSIDELTGNIRIRESLDFEEMQIYNITVIARDEGEPSLLSMASLIIEVEDVNENYYSPKFSDIVATAKVKENLPIGSFVTKVTAVDDDSDLSLVYQIIGGDGLGRFTIDSNGYIHTAAVLDCETNSHYWLTIVAKDRAAVPLTAYLELYISIENENDLAPITSEAFYYARVSENASIGSNVLQIEAHDPDLNADTETKIKYRIINEVPFTIDQNGLVKTKSKLDRETQSRYVIDVEVSEDYNIDLKEPVMTTMLSRTPIVVNVIDVNEFEPKSILSIYRCQAYNDISQKIPICQIVAIDRDDDENCVLQYKFIEGNDYNWFSIDQKNGAIYTAKDGIPKGEYDYIISVSDCGTPRKSSQVRVILRILSVSKGKQENRKPIIEAYDPEISISERESIGYAVTLIKAIDADNDRLCYHIISGNIGNTFAFRDGGALIVAKPLSYKLTNRYNLTISVTDGINSSLVNLLINLIDVFDNRVSFIQDSYTVNVLENITKGSEILQLSISDREFSDGIVFSIYSTFSPESLKKFEVEGWSGKIKIKEPLDYESGKHHMLVIEAYNSRVKSLSSHDRSFAKVSINIIDVNDETPTFILPHFEANIMETSAIGTSVLQVQAVDKDVGTNAKINYSIISGNVDNIFDIDNDLGFVFLAKPLNARQQSEYYIVIKATDKGLPPLSSTANVHISVSIPDNSPPKFEQKLYSVDVDENEKIGTVIIALKVMSRQSLYFEIVSGNNENKFSINVNNGEVWLRSELDYETNQNYSLTISATSLVGANDTTKLFINVIDINDCVPYWKLQAFNGHILESAQIGSIILDDNDSPLVIKAFDDDSMHNSILVYSIIEEMGRKYFNIEPRTGAITLARRIDYEKRRQFNFTVTAVDLGFPSLKAATNAFVKIDCLPVNDCAPVLSLNHYHSTVLLPTYKNVIVTKISATDCDFGKHDEQHDHFVFSLTPITLSSEKKFSINSTSGLITTSDDRITEGVYEMFVSVFDGKFTSEAKVTITTEPIPRSSLRFTQEKFVGHLTENSSAVKTILMPTIEGNKLNEHLTFRILNPTNLFRIARTSGAILSRGIPIDREEKSRFELVIEVRSIFSKTRVAHALIEINVEDINDNKPVFVGLPYYFVFGNDFQAGTQIGKVQAIDVDVGYNGMVTYSIISGDQNKLFTLNADSGHISIARSANAANDPHNYSLLILAKDSGSVYLESYANVTIKMVSGGMPLFDKQFYSVSVMESHQSLAPFLSINAESPHGRQLIYSIVSGNDDEEFSLDFNTGMISIIEKLDRESVSQYNLIISATDSISGVSATVPLLITVDDANDNPPMFTKFSYNVSISESTPIGANIVKISATDSDIGLNAKLQYHILGNKSHFYISPEDGIIYLKTALDHETESMHHFTVMATDYGSPVLTSTAHVWVEVLDVNDNKPIVPSAFTATIDENIEKGQFVTRITANDPDSSDIKKLRYQILSGNDNLSFSMNETTGIVTVWNLNAKKFRKHIRNYDLNVSVTDGVYSTTTNLQIIVKPANYNSPKFTRIFNNVAISELTPIGSTITQLTAIDKDEGIFGQLSYHIINDNANRHFSIDPISGNITLHSEIDREAGHRLFWLTIGAQDGGKRIGISNLRVAITDENDNSPRFIVDEYKSVICSNVPIGVTILPVMAVDDDDYSENNVIQYSIYDSNNSSSGQNILDMFGITSETGHIYTRKNLSNNVGDIVQFFVKASDGSRKSRLENVVPVSIQMTGSCPFVKRQTSVYEIFVNENTKRGTIIANVNLAGLKEVELAIVGFGDKSDLTKFRIDRHGRIHLIEQLDRETKSKHILAVHVRDKITFAISYLNILINVMDENDCVPYFDSTSYNIIVSEDQEIGSSVMKVHAIDADIDVSNNALKYSLEKNDNQIFSIDENTGWITLTKKLDRETISWHNLTVGVTDGTHYNSTSLNIQVYDVNDNEPIVKNNYMASIYENSPMGTIIVSIDAIDYDQNSELSFYILSGDPFNQFEIGQNGEIYINKALDRETIDRYKLEIIVTDGRFATRTWVTIDILDTNDNGPICMKSKYVELVSEAVSPGTFILTVEATDLDDGENAKLYYFLSGDLDSHFTIDHQLGHLKTKTSLDREKQANYLFEVHISDDKRRDWSCKSEVEILLSDVNDEAPKFSNPYYSVNVPEDSSVGIIIGKVTATDADLGVNRKVRYKLSTNTEEFEIDEKTGIMRLAKTLDREIQAFYNLTIKAYDSGAAQLYSTATFVVSVMDINDNAPEFEMQSYNAMVSENSSIGTEVLKVFATSKDTGINAEIKYHILNGNENGTFSIHSKSGIISVAKSLDYESVKEYFMTIRAEDGGIPSLSSEAHVTIRLSDINDVSPQFVQRSYDIVIREDAIIGDRIIQLVAIDSDSSENANLTYSFSGGSLSYKEFQINSTSGIITVAKSLDREMISSYILEAVCNDNGFPESLSSSVLVNIEISDSNDNSPLFEKTNYTIYVQEGRPIGYSLINFNIHDADSAANSGPFSFKLLSGNTDDSFTLVNEDASLRTNTVFNHSSKSNYSLNIQVTDSGTPPLHSNVSVHVLVTQEPQVAPQLSSLSVTVNSLEQFPGGIIGQVSATDGDPFDKLSYSVTNENDKHLFSIDATDGTLVAFPGLDSGKYKINITVSDGKYLTFGSVELEVIMITESMIENSIVVELRSISVKDFVTNYKKTFIRVMKNVFNVRMKDIIILSVQPAEHKDLNRFRRNENSLGDISVLFSVAKTRGGYFSRQWLKAKLVESKAGIEKQLGILMEDFIMKSECQHIACKHGECRDELILSENDVISIIGNKLSFVSPFHEHKFGCACHPGFGGKLCEIIVNECARNPCPSFKECLPVSSPLGYLCQCPFGKSGPMCNQNAETCHSSDRDVSFCYEELNPISFHGNSYARYSFTKKVEKISLRFKSQQLRANIFTQTGEKSYNILEMAGGYIQYRFDCGNGEGLIRVENLIVSDGKWHEISVERKSNTASLTLDRKYRGGGFAPGFTGCLDLHSDLFFGGSVKPRSNAIGGEEITLGFIGCLDNILLNGHQIPLHMTSTSSAAILKTLANVEFSCNFKPDIGPCKTQPCLNGGTCHNLINGSYQCICVGPKYRGINCEIDMSPCDTLPCMNGGLCRHDEALCKSGVANCYKCECGPSFTGLNCQVPRYCSSNLCQNGGVCEETSLGPKCHCHAGWHGLYCQYDIDECQLSTPVCGSPATCINLPGTFRCICPINATGISCNGEGLYTTNIISSQLHITFDEIVGILITLAVLAVSGCILAFCWKCKNKSRRNRTPNNFREANELLLKHNTHNEVNLKRFSKISNFEMGNAASAALALPQRPTSYTETQNNFDSVRPYASAVDELETIPCNDFIQNFKKNAPIASVSPQLIESNSSNSKPDSRKQLNILNDAKPSPPCKTSSTHTRASYCDSDSSNVFNEEQSSSLTNSNNAEGYHWDCSDWVVSDNNKSIPNLLLEVSVNEIHDSESNSDNSQIELSVNDSHERTFHENDETHENSPLLTLNDDLNEIEFADKSEPSSPQKYLDLYLPKLTDNEWMNNNKRKNILTYTSDMDSVNANINEDRRSHSMLNFTSDDSNNVCDIEDLSECEDYDDSNQQSTYV